TAAKVVQGLRRRRVRTNSGFERGQRSVVSTRFDQRNPEAQVRRRIGRHEPQLLLELGDRLVEPEHTVLDDRDRPKVVMRAADARILLQRDGEGAPRSIVLAGIAVRSTDQDVRLGQWPCGRYLAEETLRGIDLLQPQVPRREGVLDLRIV